MESISNIIEEGDLIMPKQPYPDGPKDDAFDIKIDVLTPEFDIQDMEPYSEHDQETGELIESENYTMLNYLTDVKEHTGIRYFRLKLKPKYGEDVFKGGLLWMEEEYYKSVERGDINPEMYDVTYAV